jgi:hypothetical protein
MNDEREAAMDRRADAALEREALARQDREAALRAEVERLREALDLDDPLGPCVPGATSPQQCSAAKYRQRPSRQHERRQTMMDEWGIGILMGMTPAQLRESASHAEEAARTMRDLAAAKERPRYNALKLESPPLRKAAPGELRAHMVDGTTEIVKPDSDGVYRLPKGAIARLVAQAAPLSSEQVFKAGMLGMTSGPSAVPGLAERLERQAQRLGMQRLGSNGWYSEADLLREAAAAIRAFAGGENA